MASRTPPGRRHRAGLPTRLARRVHLGRRCLRHPQQASHHARRPDPHLVLARFSLAILPARLHRLAPRTRPLGPGPGRISLGQPPAARRQCAPPLALARAPAPPGLLARGGPFRPSSRPSRIRRLGDRAEKRPLVILLSAGRARLAGICRRPARPLAMVCGGPPLSGPGADRQNHRLHPARRAFPHPLAAPKTHPPPALPATGPLPRPGRGHGLGHRLVGTLPPIHRRLRLLHRPGRTPPHRQPRRLVLRRQTPLAGNSLLQLPALAHRSRRPACLDLAGGRPRRLRLDLCPAQDRRTRTGNRRALFRGHALALARLHHGIHFPLHLRGRTTTNTPPASARSPWPRRLSTIFSPVSIRPFPPSGP